MNFKESTDLLCQDLGHEDVAKMLNVSVQTVRQARLSPTAKAYRQPPPNWEAAIAKLAERQLLHYRKLLDRLNGMRTKISK